MRTRWTDERLDEFFELMRPLPAQSAALTAQLGHVTTELARLSADVENLKDETRALRGDMNAIRGDLSALQLQVGRIGWTLAAALLGNVAAVALALSA